MDPIKSIIHDVIGKMAARAPGSDQDIQALWAKISGGSGSRAVELKEDCLIVHVDSPMRMVKLNLYKSTLVRQINQEFPAVGRIHFKVAKI